MMIYDLSFMPGPDDYIALIVIMIIILKLLVFAVEHGSSLLAWDKNSENYHHLHHQHHCHLDFPPGPPLLPPHHDHDHDDHDHDHDDHEDDHDDDDDHI